ncbi:MAG: 50S ribosomal protein L29 [Candidatus Buchananbacteria bacterium]|nr:50S ribosomal protein L29 [Candidatus Buchananbacteria bacterium]
MDIKEIRNKPVAELNQLLDDLRKKLADLKFKVFQNQLKNIREVRVIKKDIAKVMTALGENKKVK